MSLYWGTFNKFAKDFRAFGESEAARRRQETLDKVKMYSDLRKAGYTTKDMEGMALTLPDGSTWVPGKEVSKVGTKFQEAYEKGLASEVLEQQFGPARKRRAGERAGAVAGAQEGAKEPYREKARTSTQAHDFAKMYESSRLNLSNQMQLLNKRLNADFFKFQERNDQESIKSLSKTITDAADEYMNTAIDIENQLNNYQLKGTEKVRLQRLKQISLMQYKFKIISAANAVMRIYENRHDAYPEEDPPDDIISIYMSQHLNNPKEIEDLYNGVGSFKASQILGKARWYNTLFGQKEDVEEGIEELRK